MERVVRLASGWLPRFLVRVVTAVNMNCQRVVVYQATHCLRLVISVDTSQGTQSEAGFIVTEIECAEISITSIWNHNYMIRLALPTDHGGSFDRLNRSSSDILTKVSLILVWFTSNLVWFTDLCDLFAYIHHGYANRMIWIGISSLKYYWWMATIG